VFKLIYILPLEKTDAINIVRWNESRSADFLQQWAGLGYEFPVTECQIIDRLDKSKSSDYILYKIMLDNEMIGTVELFKIDKNSKSAVAGRFLLNPIMTGKGYGTEALKKLLETAYNMDLKTIQLVVFDFNKSAYRCYEKVGFKKISQDVRPNGWIAIRMEIILPVK
jgi:RimJ/RimL family protein N-acetyltransferase